MKLVTDLESGSIKENGQTSTPSPQSSTGTFHEDYVWKRLGLMGTLSKAKASQGIKNARLKSFLEGEWVLFMQSVLLVSEKVLEPERYSVLKTRLERLLGATGTGSSTPKPE